MSLLAAVALPSLLVVSMLIVAARVTNRAAPTPARKDDLPDYFVLQNLNQTIRFDRRSIIYVSFRRTPCGPKDVNLTVCLRGTTHELGGDLSFCDVPGVYKMLIGQDAPAHLLSATPETVAPQSASIPSEILVGAPEPQPLKGVYGPGPLP